MATFRRKDNARTVTTVDNSIEVYKLLSRKKSELFNKGIDNKRHRKKVSSSTGAMIINYLEEGEKWKKEMWTYRKNLPLIEAENTVLELTRPVTQDKHVSINSESNKENNTNDRDKKRNNDTEETMGNVDTNNTVLEPSKSPTNMTDVGNNNEEDNSEKSEVRDNTNDTRTKNKDGTKETIESVIALVQVSVGKIHITNGNENMLEDTDS